MRTPSSHMNDGSH